MSVEIDYGGPLARDTDPPTSHMAASEIQMSAKTKRARLLKQYGRVGDMGLIDDEAGDAAGIHLGYWKRCSDLRNSGYIAPDGSTRLGHSGKQQMVCRITDLGKGMLASGMKDDAG